MNSGKELAIRISLRWVANTFALWLAAWLISDVSYGENFWVIVLAGLILSIVNTLVKPLVVMLSLPVIVFSLGIFTIFINGLMVWLVSLLLHSFEVTSFGAALLTGIIVGLVNYAVTSLLEEKFRSK